MSWLDCRNAGVHPVMLINDFRMYNDSDEYILSVYTRVKKSSYKLIVYTEYGSLKPE